jgi:hypothetical protein
VAVVGRPLVVMVMSEVEDIQGELLIDQVRTVVPAVNPVMVLVAERELVIVPLPETFIHRPVPEVGMFPARVVDPVLTQIVWLGPAFEMEGSGIPVIVTFEAEAGQGKFVILHRKTFGPVPRPVTVVFGRRGFVIVPLPEINVHEPVPTAAVLPAIVAPEETHTV